MGMTMFGPIPAPMTGGVHRQEQVAALARGQVVGELDAHRPVLLGRRSVGSQDSCELRLYRRDRSVIGAAGIRRLHVPARGRIQVRVHLLGVLDPADLVVVRARIRRRIGDRDGDVLPEVVRRRPPSAPGKRVDELLNAAGDRLRCPDRRSAPGCRPSWAPGRSSSAFRPAWARAGERQAANGLRDSQIAACARATSLFYSLSLPPVRQ